jgi:hypothetical protein
MKKTYVVFLLILSLFLVYYKTELNEQFPSPTSGSFPDKLATSNGYILSGYSLDSTNKYSKAVGPNSVLLVEVDTVNKKSIIYSVYTVRHSEKRKSLAIR